MLAPRELWGEPQPLAKADRRPAPRRRRSRRAISRSTCAALLVIVVFSGLAVAHRRSTLVQLGYQSENLATQLAIVRKHNAESAVEVARLGSLSRVQLLAEQRLGMVRPGNTVILVTRDEGVHAVEPAALGTLNQLNEPDSDGGVFARLWRLLVRLASSPVEAARAGT